MKNDFKNKTQQKKFKIAFHAIDSLIFFFLDDSHCFLFSQTDYCLQ